MLDPERVLNWSEPLQGREVHIATTSAAGLVELQLDQRPVLMSSSETKGPFQDAELNTLWSLTIQTDTTYKSALRAL